MILILLTTRFPYSGHRETFLQTEFHELADAFDQVHLLPLYAGAAPTELPPNVTLWPALRTSGPWFIPLQFLYRLTWRRFAEVLTQCRRLVGFTPNRLKNCVRAACIRSAFERHRGLSALFRSAERSVVYAYWGVYPALALPTAKALGNLTVARYHNIDLYLERADNDGFIPWRDDIQANIDLHVFISRHGQNYFEDHAEPTATGDRLLARLGSPDCGPATAPRPQRQADSPIVLVSVSHIIPVKRVHQILRFAKALARDVEVEWHHFGGGSYPELASELGRPQPDSLKVQFHGPTPWADVQQFYRERTVTAFVNLSEFEGIPVSIMEAMNAGIPVIGTDVCGTAEAVLPGRSGMLVELDLSGKPERMAEAVLKALEPGGDLARSRPREVWAELYDAQQNALAFVAELKALGS